MTSLPTRCEDSDSDDADMIYLDANEFSDTDLEGTGPSGDADSVSSTQVTDNPEDDFDDAEFDALISSARVSAGGSVSFPGSTVSQSGAVVASTAASTTLVDESVQSLEEHFARVQINYGGEGRDKTRYRVGSGNQELEKDWALAAEQAHHRGKTVRAVKKQRKRCPAGRYHAYVVFVGATPGVYSEWEECKAECYGQSSSVYSGYITLTQAEAVFQYALDKDWVRYTNSL